MNMRYSEKRIEVNPESILKVGRAEYRRPRGRPKSHGKTCLIKIKLACTNLLLIHLRVYYKESSKYNPSRLVHFTTISPQMVDYKCEKGTHAIKVDQA